MRNKNERLITRRAIGLIGIVLIVILSGCSSTNVVDATSEQPAETTGVGVNSSNDKTDATSDKEDYTTLFSDDKIHEINIEIAASDWAEMLASPEDETYFSANITVDGNSVNDVGFRTKGNSSLMSVASSASERYSFRIKMDKYVDDQNLLGLDEFVLNNMFSDASYMREYLSYKIMGEEGLNVPLNNYVQVKINGELYGLYLMVEVIDDSYLTRVFGDNDGNLYKQESGSNLNYEENSMYKSSEQKNGKDESKEDLSTFIKTLNDMPDGEKGDIESVLDVESALKYIAGNTVLENYDSYNGTFAQNYYLYNKDGKFVVLPWDLNMSFGGFQGGGQSTIDIDEPISGTTMEKVPMIRKLLDVPEYKERYYEIIKEYIALLDDFENQVTAIADKIRPYVSSDPTKFVTMEQFELNVTYQEGGATEANEGKSGFPSMTDRPVDAQTSATQATDATPPQEGNLPAYGGMPVDGTVPADGKFPDDGNRPDIGERPNFENGQKPDGNFYPEGRVEGRMMGNKQGGMSLTGSSASLINIIQARIENLEMQLSEK
ncbi:CotH kinase family protein [Fusibacter bizertensis]